MSDIPESAGLPVHWVNGGGFVMVSPDLTRALDGEFIAAGVAGRIWFLTERGKPDIDEHGNKWVLAAAQEIADWMGISVRQVRRALTILEESGYIIRQNRNKDSWDRTLSIALVYRDRS